MAAEHRKISNAVDVAAVKVICSDPPFPWKAAHPWSWVFHFYSIFPASLLACAFQMLSDLSHIHSCGVYSCGCTLFALLSSLLGEIECLLMGFFVFKDICSWSPPKK